MALRVEIKKDITGTNWVLVIGNCRKILADNEIAKMKKIAKGSKTSEAAKYLLNYFKNNRLDIIREADLDKPNRRKLITEAIIKILNQYF